MDAIGVPALGRSNEVQVSEGQVLGAEGGHVEELAVFAREPLNQPVVDALEPNVLNTRPIKVTLITSYV